MKVIVDGKSYDYDNTRLLYSEIAFIQKKTGLKLNEWNLGLEEMDAFAVAGLVYIVRKRAGEHVDWDTLDFDIAGVETVPDDDENEAVEAPKEAAPPKSRKRATGT